MNNLSQIKTVGIVGMGALGLLYGQMITKAGKARLCYIMDESRAQKKKGTVFTINNEPFNAEIITPANAFKVDLLIVAVKYPGLDSALEAATPFVGENTTIISVMNGIISEEIIGGKFGTDKVVYTVAQGMDAMHIGSSLVFTKAGSLFIGMPQGRDVSHLNRLKDFLNESSILYTHEQDIMWRLWFKFMLNVGINQTCMVYGIPYGIATAPGKECDMMIAAMSEVIAIAEKEGIALTQEQLYQCIEIEKTLDPTATPSMGQDRINHNKSEVELFAGTVIKYARKHGLPCPANEFYYESVKKIEAEYITD